MPVTSTASATRLSTTMRRVSVAKIVTASSRWIANTTAAKSSVTRAHARATALRCGVSADLPSPGRSCPVTATGALLLFEAIAHAVEGLDHLEVVVHGLELLAQPLDVAVDGAV